MLKIILESPIVKLFIGLIMLYTSGAEILTDFKHIEETIKLGAHHGVLVFGLAQVLQSLPDLKEALDDVSGDD